jgi:hypothetical protein
LQVRNSVAVVVNGQVQQTIAFTGDHEVLASQLQLQLEPGESVIVFDSLNGPARTSGDSRDLAISLLNVRPKVEATGEHCALQR